MNDSHEKGKEGEKFVYELAKNSFFSHWCYPNPMDQLGDKKEICDLIIHFNEALFLVCVKNYEFKGFYERYFRKAIEKDVRQLYGAEKKILNSGSDIIIKNINEKSHLLERTKIKKVFRILVHLGDKVHFYPFNRATKNEGFVNVFDKTSFHNIITYLDTASDFQEYLEKRENAFGDKEVLIMPSEEQEFDASTGKQFFEHHAQKEFKGKDVLISGTESDLLAHYIGHKRNFSEHVLSKEYSGMLLQIDGGWEEFLKKEEVKNKMNADAVSYFIDEFVKREILPAQNEMSVEYARELLSFNRFDRRVISKNFFDFVKTYNNKRGFYIARRYGEIKGIAFIYVFYTVDMTEEQIDVMLPVVIDTYSVYTKYKHEKIILLATTSKLQQFKFAIQKDIKPFDEEKEKNVLQEIKTLNWFTDLTEIPFSEKEFPK
jgi:hypothetical protein